MARKLQLGDLPPQTDPRAPLDAATFLRAARPVLAGLTADLLTRADGDPGIRHALERQHDAALSQSRTADDYLVWRRRIVVQVAVAWLLSCVFVRALEDRGLTTPRIAGPGAQDSEAAFFRIAPSLGEREYLRVVFRELTRLPAAAALFDPAHNLIWRLGPSADGCKQLLQLFRSPGADAPAFRFGQPDTRFLGDLYQDLDDGVREQFALLQTPDFIESFILDRTLEPAIAEYGVDHTDIIDPTCGSGHFLLGSFTRICAHLRRAHPGRHDRELANTALDHIYGVDINPYAVGIARFRLTLQFLETNAYTRLHGAPAPTLHVIVADSLYYGFAGGQGDLSERPSQNSESWGNTRFSLEDPEAARKILVERTYAAVVGNPPYITVRDPALRENYRKKYSSASGKYALSAPFMERFFQLAKQGGGYTGQITSNSFMKREFGAVLVENILPNLDLDLVINTAGAFIPGHGTPTVMIFGRNRPPNGDFVQTVLAKAGEPSEPPVPSDGQVWSSIHAHWDDEGYENDFISVYHTERKVLRTHPWSLEGGGSAELKRHIDSRGATTLVDAANEIGPASFTGLDDLFLVPKRVPGRANIPSTLIRPVITGESLRDWSVNPSKSAFCPYSITSQEPLKASPAAEFTNFLWPYRAASESVISFGGKTRAEVGDVWWQWYRWQVARYRSRFRIAYAEIATHNHFALEREKFSLSSTAPVITLPTSASEDDYLGILAYLNSSTTCFWMKQIAYPKGTPTGDISTEKGKPENNRYAFSGTAIGRLPVPSFEQLSTLIYFSQSLENLQTQRKGFFPEALLDILNNGDLTSSAVTLAEQQDTALLARMVAVQEDLDWAVYALFDLAPPETAGRWTEGLELSPEQRPFKNSTPPGHLGPADRDLWLARAAAIAGSKQLRLIENPVNKRRWWGARGVFAHKVATFAERVADAAAERIADLAEQVLRARCEHATPTVVTARELERALAGDPHYQALRDHLVTDDARVDPLRDQLGRESVPFLAGHRYSPSGLERHARWREVWDLQRLADVSEARIPDLRDRLEQAAAAAREATARVAAARGKPGGPTTAPESTPRARARRAPAATTTLPTITRDEPDRPPALLAAEAAEAHALAAQQEARLELEWAENHHRKVRKLIPVPSKYEPADFRDPTYFRLRGKLDVPRERFISYPGAASDGDGAPVYGWAGWNHLQRALALLQLYYQRKLEEAWPAARLVPLLAGLEELLPWVKQWHADERHVDTGERYVDALESHIAAGCSELAVTRAQLVAWTPPDARSARAAGPSLHNRNRAPKVKQAATKPPPATAGDSAASTRLKNRTRGAPERTTPPVSDPSIAVTNPTKSRGRPRKSGTR